MDSSGMCFHSVSVITDLVDELLINDYLFYDGSMKNRILIFIIFTLMAAILVSALLASCSKSPAAAPAVQTPQAVQPPAAAPAVTGAAASLSETDARKIAQGWIDSHPFQLGSELETDYTEYFYNGAEYYLFQAGVVMFGLVEILIHKETGELFQFMSPGNDTLELLDDWYNREHGPSSWADSTEWKTVATDWMYIDIPSLWSWSYGPDYPDLDDIDIYSEDGSIHLFAGYMIAGNPEDYIAENLSKPFAFDSGTIGYVFESPKQTMWLNPDLFLGFGVAFYHDRGNFADNEELILQIVRSFRSN